MSDIVITDRDESLLTLLGCARWLTTSQIQESVFGGVSVNAVNKRLRKLADARFLRSHRPGLTEECWFRLGAVGVRHLERHVEIVETPRRLPIQRAHFKSINDVRLWFNTRENLDHRFFAEWELKGLFRGAIVPDGILLLRGRPRLAIEIDLGTENATFFAAKLRA